MEIGAPTFLRISLRTELLLEAMTRATALTAAMELAESRVMSECVTRLVQPDEVKAIVDETIRAGVAAMLCEEAEAAPRTPDQADAALAHIGTRLGALRQALRLRDHAAAVEPARAAAAALGMDAVVADSPPAARGVMGGMIDLAEAALAVERGATVDEATRAIRAERFDGAPADRLPRSVMLTAASAHAVDSAVSKDMANKQRGTGRLMFAFFGEAPVDHVFSPTRLTEWVLWLNRVPRNWANAHGKNRYTSVGREVDVHAVIAKADADDAALRAGVEARSDLSLREKRRILASGYVERMAEKTVIAHHGRAKAIHDSARALGWAGGAWTPVLKDWKRATARLFGRCDDPLMLHVTQQKRRLAWTDERLFKHLTSTMLTGCFSQDRRWRKGEFAIRDAIYWVPLLVLMCGLRPEEALKLIKSDVQFRDGIVNLRIEETPDGPVKNWASERFVPLPEALLRLGFLEWWRDACERPGEALFPEVPASTLTGRISDVFGKRLGRMLKHLGVKDLDEDFYALRHTFITRLQLAGAPDGLRQAIVGHEQDEIINANYTSANLRLFKQYMDRIDHRLEIGEHPRHGFPVIVGCGLTKGQAIDIAVSLTAKGARAWSRGICGAVVGSRP
ncbi:Phage integrase family protein [Rubrimonas cliftonensis]|uniref:Phage integrase family protein n=1 Tax=Rubrimonas cliftonensis TaxID=89524 RepID=A0A1H4BRE7_9RHOB|nr:tyrosine-type recombinase/integrase [Rubrimonas cliftonensis]SEA50701.1 Phage integrase family protein [Rubrimonas cliftonensis]